MGNRAVITTEEHRIGVYLHWNGGRDSVEAFLEYCKLHGYRKPEDDDYGWARLCQVIANFIGADGCSVGIENYDRLDTDNGDNGVYVIRDWEIVSRDFFSGEEQSEYDLTRFLHEIDSCMPEAHRIGTDMIDDLLKYGLTLNDLGCDYFYSIWKGKGKRFRGFEIGKDYMSRNHRMTVKDRISPNMIRAMIAGTEESLRTLRWKDGRESAIIIDSDITECILSSDGSDPGA